VKATALLVPVLLLLPLAVTQLPAADDGAELVGNYCRECHTPGDARLAAPLVYVASSELGAATPCSVVDGLRREVYHTGQLAAILDSPGGEPDERTRFARLAFIRATEGDLTSAEATAAQVQALRRRLSESHALLQQAHLRRWQYPALAVTVAVALVLLVGANSRLPACPFAATLGLLAVLVFVALSPAIFRGPAEPVESAGERARRTAIERADSVAEQAERSAARAWMMGQIGAEWAALDEARGEEVLDGALRAAADLQSRRFTLWREARAALEGPGGDEARREAARIRAVTSRAWVLRDIGRAWTPVDPARAAAILALARSAAEENESAAAYRDLDLRSVAVAQAELDVQQGLQTVGLVRDPALRCWGLREIAARASGARAADIYRDALAAAREIDDPLRRARALLETGRLWATADEKAADAVFAEAQKAAEEAGEGPGKAYLLSDLAAAWAVSDPQKGQSVAETVNGDWAEARVTAIHRVAVAWLGEDPARADALFRLAWDVSGGIKDAYSRARIRLTMISAWAALAPEDLPYRVGEIELPLLRVEAEQKLALAWPDKDKALEMAREIEEPYFQVEALTGIGSALAETAPTQAEALFREAAALGNGLPAPSGVGDASPLRDLAVAWAGLDPPAALRLVDRIELESDRADALRAIAVAQARRDPASADETFERALRQALAVRVPGDELAAASATLELARAFAPISRDKAERAFRQALELAVTDHEY
jgi:hypothetical protein